MVFEGSFETSGTQRAIKDISEVKPEPRGNDTEEFIPSILINLAFLFYNLTKYDLH